MSELKTVIVTGGSRGLGAAICRKLASIGHPVAVNYASNSGAAEDVVRAIAAAGGRAQAFPADVSREEDVRRLFDDAQEALGTLGGVVSNAGIIGGSSRVDQLSVAALDRTLAINVVGPVLCAREAVLRLSTRHGGQGGAIVNMSSVAARLGAPGEFVHYAASKGAIDSFTLGLAREVAGEGIRVNAVAPGLIETDMNPPERLARLPRMCRSGGPACLTRSPRRWLGCYLRRRPYVTGSILTVSGGR